MSEAVFAWGGGKLVGLGRRCFGGEMRTAGHAPVAWLAVLQGQDVDLWGSCPSHCGAGVV